MQIRDLVIAAHEMAKKKGWWDDAAPNLFEKLVMVHAEVSEAVECLRIGEVLPYAINRKPEGLPSELADIVIRVADFCGQMGINLEAAIKDKMAYNATRAYRHGGKLA